jgi:hypothetical protein
MKSKLFSMGMLSIILTFGFIIFGCDNGSTNNNDDTGNTGNNNLPSAPTNVSANALSSSSISVSWSSVIGATGYEIYYSGSSSGTKNFITNVTETTYTHNGLISSTTYYYFIKTKNNNGSSGYSSFGNATTLSDNTGNNNLPSAPTNVSANALSSSSISVSWSSVIGATGYEVYYSGSSSGTKNFITNVTGTTYTHNGLISSTTYYYFIKTKNNNGSSGYSSFGNATTLSEVIAGSSSSNAITINGSISGNFSSGLNEVWYKFTKNGEGVLSASDRESSSVYTANIVIDVYNASLNLVTGAIYSNAFTLVGNGQWYNIDVGKGVVNGYSLYSNNWSGTYYIKVRPLNNNNANKGNFALIAP